MRRAVNRRNASRERHEAGLKALMKLNQQTNQLYKDLRDSGVEFEMHENGLLIAALSEKTLEEYAELLETAKTAGYTGEVRILGKEALLKLEPALSDAIVGTVYVKDDLHVRPDTLASGLAGYLAARDVDILEYTEVHALEPAGKGRWLVSTSSEKLAADQIVVAAGMWSSELLGNFGVRIPLESGKGYSVTASGRGTKPWHAMKLAEPNVGCSPFEDAVRISGIFELGGRDLSVNRRLLDSVLRSASVCLRDWVVEELCFEWAGMRPTTPDVLPLISAVPGFGHLYVATGYGMLGVTLAPTTAVALALLVLEDRTVPELEPFSSTGSPADVPTDQSDRHQQLPETGYLFMRACEPRRAPGAFLFLYLQEVQEGDRRGSNPRPSLGPQSGLKKPPVMDRGFALFAISAYLSKLWRANRQKRTRAEAGVASKSPAKTTWLTSRLPTSSSTKREAATACSSRSCSKPNCPEGLWLTSSRGPMGSGASTSAAVERPTYS
jgi:D-amino-acid dehydrogenase